MNYTPFSQYLSTLRRKANLTNKDLAKLADVPASLIAGLQSGKRRIGEYQARKIGTALGLIDCDLETFVYSAINNSADKVLESSKNYPAELLNHLAQFLKSAGVLAEQILGFGIQSEEITLSLSDGSTAILKTQLNH